MLAQAICAFPHSLNSYMEQALILLLCSCIRGGRVNSVKTRPSALRGRARGSPNRMNLTLALPKKDNGAIPRHFLKQCIRKDCGLPDLGVRRKPTKIRVRDEASYPPSGNALCSCAGLFGVNFSLIRQRVAGGPRIGDAALSAGSQRRQAGKQRSPGRAPLGSESRIVTPWSLQAFDCLSKLFAS